MTHFTDNDLARWREDGPGADRPRVLEHLRECGECAARYAEAVRTRPLAAREAAADADEFVEAGYAAGRRAGAPPAVAATTTRRWLIGLAAAACLVAAVAVPRMMRHEEMSATMQFRGAGLHSLAPVGAVQGDVEFVWSSAIVAPRFRLSVSGPKGMLYTVDTTAMRTTLPAAVRQSLEPDVEYSWSVAALDADGKTIATSERRAFAIRRP